MKWFLVATNILLLFFIFLTLVDVCSGDTATKKPSWLRSKVSKAKDWVKDHRPHLRSSSNSDKKDKSWARSMIDRAKTKFSSSGSSKNTGGYGSYGGTSYGSGGGSSYPSSGGYSNTGRSSYPSSGGLSSGGYGGNNQYSGGYSGGSYSSGGGYPNSYPTNTGGGSYPAQPPAQSGQYPIPGNAYPTKKPSFFERAKQKVKSSGVIPKAVGFVKKDLGIGVVGPKPESKILKYGRKAFEKLLGKKKVAAGAGIGGAAGYAAGRESSSSRSGGYDYDSTGNYQNPDQDQEQEQDQGQNQDDTRDQGQGGAIRGILKQQISVVEEEVDEIQNELQATWNMSEAGSRYKIFEEPLLKWEDAQEFCYNHGANLAVIDSDSKNQYVKELLTETMLNTTQVLWFGLHTEIATTGQQQQQGTNNQKTFSNFQSESIPGCGVIDLNGVWSISSCMLQLPFICQAIKLNGEVFIP